MRTVLNAKGDANIARVVTASKGRYQKPLYIQLGNNGNDLLKNKELVDIERIKGERGGLTHETYRYTRAPALRARGDSWGSMKKTKRSLPFSFYAGLDRAINVLRGNDPLEKGRYRVVTWRKGRYLPEIA